MKIAVWHNVSGGGAKRVLYDQVRNLVANGHHVEAWCPPSANRSFLPLSELITEHVVPLRMAGPVTDRLTLREFSRDQRDDIVAMDEHCKACATEIDGGGFDVLLAHCCRFYRATAIGRMTNLPSLFVAEPYRPLYEAAPTNGWAAPQLGRRWWSSRHGVATALRDASRLYSRRIQVREEITNAAGFDRLLAYSSFTREMIRSAFGLDAAVCYPGIDTESFPRLDRRREPFVMSVGTVCPEKNLLFVIDALGRLPIERRPRLVWVCDYIEGDHLREVVARADERKVDLEVRHMVDHATLVELLNTATVMLYAPRLEPLGLAPLEAGACGLPVVATAEGGVRETIVPGRTGVLTAPTVEAFATAISELLDDPDRLAAMGAATRDHIVEHWSMAAAAARLEVYLAEVVSCAEREERDAVPPGNASPNGPEEQEEVTPQCPVP